MEINKAQAEEIKATLNTPGWVLIELMLVDKFVDNRRPKFLRGMNSKTNEQIATEAKAAEMSCKSINGFLGRLKVIASRKNKKDERFV